MGDIVDSDISFLSGFKPKQIPLSDEDVAHPNVQAYLNYLNTYEGKPKPNQTVGYKEFKDLSDHPRIKVAFNDKGDTSDAAGSYQLLGKTWDQQKKKLGLKDFSFPNQQKAAVGVLADIGALEHIKNGDFEKANELARSQWASLPGSTIGLSTGQIPKVNPEAESILAKASSDYDPDVTFLGGYKPREAVNMPAKTVGDISAFSNKEANPLEPNAPAIKQLGRRLVEDIQKPLSEISVEDWKKKSLSAPAIAYVASSLGIPGFTEEDKKEAEKKLIAKGKSGIQSLKDLANMPVEDFSKNVIKGVNQMVEHPGTVIGETAKQTIYEPETIGLNQAANIVAKPFVSGGKKIVNAVEKAAMQDPVIAAKVAEAAARKAELQTQMGQAFQNIKQRFNEPEASVQVMGAPNVGAAQTSKQSAIDAILPNLSPETQQVIKNAPVEQVNLPALETKAIEEKHGINLSNGQRSNKSTYADEWNRRKTDERIQDLFSSQPQQFSDAFEKLYDKHSANIGEINKENIGQNIIQGLLDKDKSRMTAINNAYKKLEDANGGQFPIDVAKLNENIDSALKAKLKKNVYEDKLNTIKKDIDELVKNGNMTFSDFENLRSNLADEMRTNQSGSARAAAHIIREQLESLPMSAEAQNLKDLANNARALYRERAETINKNPAYKAAIKEATTAEEAESGQAFLKSDKFHDTHVKNASPEAVRRLTEELKDNPKAMEAVRAGDILNAKEALVPNTTTPSLRPDAYNKYLRSQAEKAKYIHTPESLQDLVDLDVLAGKVAKPTENVFNYSNSTSALLGELFKQGVMAKGEAALALKTGGASIPAVGAAKHLIEKFNKDKFVNETIHPHSGLVNKE
jgi:muramidase (phage lysozyme)